MNHPEAEFGSLTYARMHYPASTHRCDEVHKHSTLAL